MGLFPYQCVICRGGEYRCGRKDKKCFCGGKGSQSCWEEDVILTITKNNTKLVIKDKYSGYGKIYIHPELINLPHIVKWEDFGLKVEYESILNNETNLLEEKPFIRYDGSEPIEGIKIYCSSCFKNHK